MSEEMTATKLRNEVAACYGGCPRDVRVVLAPYRICPLGAHIDHQLGRVTAMAIDRGVMLAYVPSPSSQVRLRSLDFSGEVDFSVENVPPRHGDDWGNYAYGAVQALSREHTLTRGIRGVTSGPYSRGGLSSSAAVGVALLMALEDANDLVVSPEENVLLDQAIENDYLGLRNGILDQSGILLSRRDNLTIIDCRSHAHNLIPYSADAQKFSILIVFSGLHKALVGTDYNRRVDECATAAKALLEAAGKPDEPHILGRLSAEEFAAHKDVLDGPPLRRAEHFFSEIQRVHRGIDAWTGGDLDTFGRLISASGESSIVNYECGCEPLIDLYRILIETEGVHGARFSGAGFRGCCVALVAPEAGPHVAERVTREYRRRHPELKDGTMAVVCRSDDGARFLSN